MATQTLQRRTTTTFNMDSFGGGGHPYQFTFDRQYYTSAQLHHTGQQQTQNTSNHAAAAYNIVTANQQLYAAQPELSVSANTPNQIFPSMLAATAVNNMHNALGYEPFDVFSANLTIKQSQQHRQKHQNNLDFELNIPGISLTPLTALEVVEKVKNASSEVTTRFLPCVDFLVSCQQELRAGLAFATKKKQVGRGSYRDNMTPLQVNLKLISNVEILIFLKLLNFLSST